MDKLNMSFYKGEDLYSDGDIENNLLDIVKNVDDFEEFLKDNDEWTYLYHLSPIRENLLEWYDFKKDATLLEIGSGCGALTGLFCRKVKKVTGIDLSKRRSEINIEKNKQYDNLEIYVGNFTDVNIDEKFDYVTLIGVLEYSVFYVGGENAFLTMLEKAKRFLKPDGKLIIAIENKFGMKYWAGAPEDHTGKVYEGIEGYLNTDRVRTFSKKAIEELLASAGLNNYTFYYPVPDYKLPTQIFSEKKLPHKRSLRGIARPYDRERFLTFDEEKVFDSVCEDGMFEFFSNSFLIFCN